MNFLTQLFILATVARPNFCDDAVNFTGRVELTGKLAHSWHQFQAFQQKFDKKYGSTSEEQGRFQHFRRNLKKIERLNAEEKGTAVYGVTSMADWSREEFLAKRASLKLVDVAENSKFMKKVNFTKIKDGGDYDPIPDEFDWRYTLSVTAVKNQGDCGSCWAFASVGNIENIQAIKTGSLRNYSAQQLIDCSVRADGCAGGSVTSGFLTVMDMEGLVPESKYPYTGGESLCMFAPYDVRVKVKGYIVLNPLDEEGMAWYIATKGSTSNAINADLLQFYKSGVISAKNLSCSEAGLNHLVLVVGYGTDFKTGLDFWTVKNSWGRDFGEEGYFRIERGQNTCGIATFISSVELADEN